MNARPLTLGFSPCPNDTYIFNALVNRRVPYAGPALAPPELEDVETLNEWAMRGELDITKVSCHAWGHLRDEYELLPAGAALGRGCGPLLVAWDGAGFTRPEDLAGRRVVVPGRYTTAALLLKLFLPDCETAALRFDHIMPAVARGEADAGVIIHESRFTYRRHGLVCVQDLGEWWERETGAPIPLGCIVMRKSLGPEARAAVSRGIVDSIRWADAHPAEGLPYIREHAQEMEAQVMRSHIDLYVNAFSKDLGDEGRRALDALLERGGALGLFPPL